MKVKITDKILGVLSDGQSHGEWEIAFHLYGWNDSNRSKHGAWIRLIVQALWRLERDGNVSHFWVSHGKGVAGDRMWFRCCDILPCEHPEWGIPHIQDDARNHLTGYDLGIGHPDCTNIANSGVQWLFKIPGRYERMKKDCEFFNLLYNARIPMKCLENPIPHKYALEFIPRYDQIIHPYYFGENIEDRESKATCLWLVNLPFLMAQFSGGEGIQQSVWKEPPSENRKANRARTFNGVANAMASQWSYYLKHLEVKP